MVRPSSLQLKTKGKVPFVSSYYKATCIGILFCLNIHKQIAYHQAGLENIIELIKEINFSILVRA